MAADKQCVSSPANPAIMAKNVGYECDHSVLTRADGSASFKQGTTEALTAVYGPAEVRLNREQIDKATIECTFKHKSGPGGCAEKVIERLIRNSCDSIILSSYHPRSAISIIVQVVHDSGHLLSTALNSAFLALLNAGISMKGMAGAVSCFLSKDGEISFEVSEENGQERLASFTFVFDSIKQNIITTHTQGTYTIEQYFECLAASREAVRSVFEFQRKSIERSLSMMLFAAKHHFSLQQRSVKMGNYLSDVKNLPETKLKQKDKKKNESSVPGSRVGKKRNNKNAEMSPISCSDERDSSKRIRRLDENRNEKKNSEVAKKTVKKIPYLKKFFKLFDDDVIQDFLWNDGCAKISDKYLLAMVYVFFRRAELSIKEYTRFNFFAALFLAHDMEEDDEELKHEIFPWAFGSRWKSKYPSLIARRDHLLKRMKFRCAVSNLTCTEVMTLCPDHPIWKRERQSYHGGATRLYPPEDEEPFRPKGPDGSPIFCDMCKIKTNQIVKEISSKKISMRENCSEATIKSSKSSYSLLELQAREE